MITRNCAKKISCVFNMMIYYTLKKKNKKKNGKTQIIFPKFIFHRVFIYFSKGG